MNALIKALSIFAGIPLLVSACGGQSVHAERAEASAGAARLREFSRRLPAVSRSIALWAVILRSNVAGAREIDGSGFDQYLISGWLARRNSFTESHALLGCI